jgi:hypothetical protein
MRFRLICTPTPHGTRAGEAANAAEGCRYDSAIPSNKHLSFAQHNLLPQLEVIAHVSRMPKYSLQKVIAGSDAGIASATLKTLGNGFWVSIWRTLQPPLSLEI